MAFHQSNTSENLFLYLKKAALSLERAQEEVKKRVEINNKIFVTDEEVLSWLKNQGVSAPKDKDIYIEQR